MPAIQLHHSLLRGVVEGYHSGTRAIVTRVGEFVPSLEDMFWLTSLRMHGEPLTGVLQLTLERADASRFQGRLPGPQDVHALRAIWLRSRLLG